ncbi:MAG TPA: DUF4230 domain-containing protein [Acidobacteriaceae bacterium]|nr:DUF4230 domain-containing protein [Acidobacteriaceae bacterium]
MTTQYNYNRRGSGTFYAFLLALVLGAVALGLFLHQATSGAMARIAGLITGRSTSIVSAPGVVEKIQRLNRLETVVYSLDTVVEGNKSSAVLPDLLAGDRMLMIVRGQTIAGVDMSQMKPDDVQITENGNERTVRIVLPPSQVFVTTIDNRHTRVYARTTGLLVPVDINLESETRAKAQVELQKAALEDGILDAASRNARSTVTAMLEGLGFQKVEVR